MLITGTGGRNYAKSQILELILKKIGFRSVKRLKGRPIDVGFGKYMSIGILKTHEVAPENFGFSKVALRGFEFDTPALRTVTVAHQYFRQCFHHIKKAARHSLSQISTRADVAFRLQ